MPKLSEHPSLSLVKALNVCDSGEGKTGCLASLVRAGYNLRIQDYDNGVQILGHLLTEAEQDRVYVETLQDPIRPTAQGPRYVSDPTAFSKGLALLDHWKLDDYDLGPLKTWTTDDVLVIDSFTMLNSAAMRYVQCFQAPKGESRLGEHPSQRDYGLAQTQVERLLQLLFNDKICPCHVVVNCHLKWVREPGKPREFTKHGQGDIEITPQKCYPNALGQALPPIVATYFNTMLTMESAGNQHFIQPAGNSTVNCKVSNLKLTNKRIEVKGAEGGMAEVFRILLGHGGPTV